MIRFAATIAERKKAEKKKRTNRNNKSKKQIIYIIKNKFTLFTTDTNTLEEQKARHSHLLTTILLLDYDHYDY